MAWSLEQPLPGRREGFLAATPLRLLATLALTVAACATLVRREALPHAVLAAAAVTAGHGALIATALAWTARDDGRRWDASGPTALVLGALALAAAGARLGHGGPLAYAIVPLALAPLAWGGRLAALGLRRPLPLRATIAGAAVGLALGGHLLVSASLTLGYRLRSEGLAAWLVTLGYDAGVNTLSSELFFRGALLRRGLARWPLGVAIAVSTAGSVARYLVDPLLPHAVETVAGAVSYLTLLGVATAWLTWWSASIVPALVASLAFFAAYRLLAVP
jgi:hypothetical protein